VGADDSCTKPRTIIHRLNDKFRANIKTILKSSPDDASNNRAYIRKKRRDSMVNLDEIFLQKKDNSPQLLIDLDELNESQESGIVQDFIKKKSLADRCLAIKFLIKKLKKLIQ
jgi:hypothetical protein